MTLYKILFACVCVPLLLFSTVPAFAVDEVSDTSSKSFSLYLLRGEASTFDESGWRTSDLGAGVSYALDSLSLGWEYMYSYCEDNFVLAYGPIVKYDLTPEKPVRSRVFINFGLANRKAFSYYTEGLYSGFGGEVAIPVYAKTIDILLFYRNRRLHLGNEEITQTAVGLGIEGRFF